MTTGKVRVRFECVERILATHSELYRLPLQTLITRQVTWGAAASWRCWMVTDLTRTLKVKIYCQRCLVWCMCVLKSWIPSPDICSVEGKLLAHQEACSDWRTRWWRHHTLAVQVSVYYIWTRVALILVNSPVLYHIFILIFYFYCTNVAELTLHDVESSWCWSPADSNQRNKGTKIYNM